MKKNILLIILSCISSCMLAQDIDSLIEIKGYYVIFYSKQEVVYTYNAHLKGGMGSSSPHYSFFVAIEIGDKVVCEEEMITKKILSYKRSDTDTIYVMPDESYNNFLYQINMVTTDVSKETNIKRSSIGFSPYYEVNENNEFLFKCIYIEGYALHRHIQEIEKKRQRYFWHICRGGDYNENAEIFFIVKIDNYTPYIELPHLKKWLPYLDN